MVLMTLGLLNGCSKGAFLTPSTTDVETSRTATPFEARFVVGESLEGRPLEVATLGSGDEVVLIVATIHGSEPAGTPLCQQLIVELRERPDLLDGRRVIVMPVANPDGLLASSRGNRRGVDLNRNFPAANRINSARFGHEALSEPEARALYRLVDTQQPDRIVSIHQPLACVDYDGPAEELAQRMSEASGLIVRKLGAQPGSLGAYVGNTLGLPIVTFELPRDAHLQSRTELWENYGEALLQAIAYD
ncbi:MAG: M14 family zinc carboxypeptidase [Phycisphaeraceae bacterium]